MSQAGPLFSMWNAALQAVPFYRERMRAQPVSAEGLDWSRLPVFEPACFRSGALIETLDENAAPVFSRQYTSNSAPSGLPKLLDRPDIDDEYRFLHFVMGRVEHADRVLVASDRDSLYASAEFTRMLAFYECPLSMICLDTGARRFEEAVHRFQPTIIVVESSSDVQAPLLRCWDLLSPHPQMFVFQEDLAVEFPNHINVIAKNEFTGPFAVRRAKDCRFITDPTCFHFDSVNHELVLTSLVHRMQPVIRLRTGIRTSHSTDHSIVPVSHPKAGVSPHEFV